MKYFIKLIPLMVLITLLLAACENVFNLQGNLQEIEKKSGVMISISSNNEPKNMKMARTLYPNTDFVKYRLEFEYEDDTEEQEDVILENDNPNYLAELADGEWTITAYGIVEIDGLEYDAAEGFDVVNVNGGFQGLNITISASVGGDNGFFSYNVSFPNNKYINDAWLIIHEYGTGYNYNEINLFDEPAGLIELSSGYYLLNVRVEDDYQYAGKTEIVHIYSKMETPANIVFTVDDFMDFITIGGMLNFNVNGESPDYMWIYAYRDINTNYYLNSTYVDNGSWEMRIQSFDSEKPVYFYVSYENENPYYYGWKYLGTYNIANVPRDDIDFTIGIISLGGTINFTVNGEVPDYISIIIYPDENYNNSIDSTGLYPKEPNGDTWSLMMDPLPAPTTFYFGVYYEFWGDTNGFVRLGAVSGLGAEEKLDIHLEGHIRMITLGGEIDIKVDGESPDSMRMYIYLDENFNNYIGYGQIYNDEGNYYWMTNMNSFNYPTTLYITLGYNFYNEFNYYGQIIKVVENVYNSDVLDIDFVESITLNDLIGTANITIDGRYPDDIWIGAYLDSNYNNGRWAEAVFDGTDYVWSMVVDSTYNNSTIYFLLEYYFADTNEYGVAELGSRFVTVGTPVNLDTALSTITISGTVDLNINLNNAPYNGPFDGWVVAYTDPEFNNYFIETRINDDKTWSLKPIPGSESVTLYLQVIVYLGRERREFNTTGTFTLSSSSTSQNIGSIGTYTADFEGILLSGTVQIYVDNEIQERNNYVIAFVNGYYYTDTTINNGSWAMLIDPFDTPTTVNFWVDWYDEDRGWTNADTGISRVVHNESITNIDLGRHDFYSSGGGRGRMMMSPLSTTTTSSGSKKPIGSGSNTFALQRANDD